MPKNTSYDGNTLDQLCGKSEMFSCCGLRGCLDFAQDAMTEKLFLGLLALCPPKRLAFLFSCLQWKLHQAFIPL